MCSGQATGVGSGPPQKAWRLSSVTKSFHFLSSKGMAQTLLRKFSCSSVISSRSKIEKQEKQALDTEPRLSRVQKLTTHHRLLDDFPSIIKPVRNTCPFIRFAYPLFLLDKKVPIFPIPIRIWHVRHKPKQRFPSQKVIDTL